MNTRASNRSSDVWQRMSPELVSLVLGHLTAQGPPRSGQPALQLRKSMGVNKQWHSCGSSPALWQQLLYDAWPVMRAALQVAAGPPPNFRQLYISKWLETPRKPLRRSRGELLDDAKEFVLMAEAIVNETVVGSCAVRMDQAEIVDGGNTFTGEGFLKLPLSFSWTADAEFGADQLRIVVSVLRSSDNKTANLLDSWSECCATVVEPENIWLEPAFMWWTQQLAQLTSSQVANGVYDEAMGDVDENDVIVMIVQLGQACVNEYNEDAAIPDDGLVEIGYEHFFLALEYTSEQGSHIDFPPRIVPGYDSIHDYFARAQLQWH